MKRISTLMALAALIFALDGSYIWGKALLAQVLLRGAWAQTSAESSARPWPWATVVPVGRLLVPDRGVDLVVLSGTTGAALAFGPGHDLHSSRPGEAGNVVLAAHRDTHFRFLAEVEPGERLWLEAPDRSRVQYVVERAAVVWASERDWMAQRGREELTLITCYPFDSPEVGGSQRYVVRARRFREGSSRS